MYKFFQQIKNLINLILTLLIFISLLSSCTILNLNSMMKPEPPKISVGALEVVKTGWQEQHFKLRLRVKNPNSFPLSFASMNFKLYLNNKQFTTGESNPDMTLPAFGEQCLVINIVSNLNDIFYGFKGLKKNFKELQLNYRIVGNVTIWKGTPQIPFEHRGEVPVKGF